jgi:hypothetical protein
LHTSARLSIWDTDFTFIREKEDSEFILRSVRKLKDKIRVVTGRRNGMGIEKRKTRLNQTIRGWVNYFKLADMKIFLKELDEWTRSRVRMVTWKRGKGCGHAFKISK